MRSIRCTVLPVVAGVVERTGSRAMAIKTERPPSEVPVNVPGDSQQGSAELIAENESQLLGRISAAEHVVRRARIGPRDGNVEKCRKGVSDQELGVALDARSPPAGCSSEQAVSTRVQALLSWNHLRLWSVHENEEARAWHGGTQ